MPKPNEPYRTDEEVLEVVRRFESCELPTADFNHREHLLVALCYLMRMGDADALSRIRARIGRYAAAHGVSPSLYHETVTVFWLKRVRAYLGRADAGLGLAGLDGRAQLLDSRAQTAAVTAVDFAPLLVLAHALFG